MVTNDMSEIELTDEVSELDEAKNIKKSEWGEVLAAGIESVIKRNPKILTEGFGVPKEVVKQVLKEEQAPYKRKCPVDGCNREF